MYDVALYTTDKVIRIYSFHSFSLSHLQPLFMTLFYTNLRGIRALMASEISSSATHSDKSSPYFLHNGDKPGAILVSQVLNGENYSSWHRSMEMALSEKNKLEFVDGSLPKPSSSASSYSLWIRCNNMVVSWLLNSISKELANSILYIDTSADIWKNLHERFSQGNGPWIFQIQKSIASLSLGQEYCIEPHVVHKQYFGP